MQNINTIALVEPPWLAGRQGHIAIEKINENDFKRFVDLPAGKGRCAIRDTNIYCTPYGLPAFGSKAGVLKVLLFKPNRYQPSTRVFKIA